MNKHLNTYFKNQVSAFKESFKMDKFVLSALLEFCKYFLLVLVFFFLLSFALKSLYNTMPLLNSVESIRDIPKDNIPQEMVDEILAQKYLLNNLLFKITIIFLSLVLLSSVVSSYFNTQIYSFLRKKKFHLKEFLHLFYIYIIYGSLATMLILSLLIFSENMIFIFISIILILLIKIYIFSIYPLAITGHSFKSDFKKGLYYKLKINRTIVPIFIGLSSLFLISISLFYTFNLLKMYLIIPIAILFISWNIWMKNYQRILYDKYSREASE